MNIAFGKDKSRAFIERYRIPIAVVIALAFISISAYGYVTNPWRSSIPEIPTKNIMDTLSNNVVVWFFYQKNCPHCHAQAPVVREVMSKRKDVEVYKIDIRKYPELAREYGIKATPTLIFNYNGRQERIEGYLDYGKFIHVVDSIKSGKDVGVVSEGACGVEIENNYEESNGGSCGV